MRSLEIQLPEDVYETLAERARRDGQSLAQQVIAELRGGLGIAAADRRRRALETVALRELRTRGALPDPVVLVREGRDDG